MRLVQAATVLLAASSLNAQDLPVLRHSPEFVIRMPDGTQPLLSSFRGKVVALLFVHTTCPHCQHASEVFSKLYAEYGSRGFEPVAVAFNPMANLYVKDFVKDHNVSFPVGFSPPEDVTNYLNIPVVARYVVPQIVWLDRKGNIRSQTPPMGDEKLLGETSWRTTLETLLKEPAEPVHRTSAHRAAPAKTTP
jgi:thiol-disulfide isomerase/thioredoxin